MAKTKHEINKVCACCELAETLNNKDIVLCSLKGVVSGGYCCKKFIYDPLKREPSPPTEMPTLNPEDLIL